MDRHRFASKKETKKCFVIKVPEAALHIVVCRHLCERIGTDSNRWKWICQICKADNKQSEVFISRKATPPPTPHPPPTHPPCHETKGGALIVEAPAESRPIRVHFRITWSGKNLRTEREKGESFEFLPKDGFTWKKERVKVGGILVRQSIPVKPISRKICLYSDLFNKRGVLSSYWSVLLQLCPWRSSPVGVHGFRRIPVASMANLTAGYLYQICGQISAICLTFDELFWIKINVYTLHKLVSSLSM